MDAKQFFFERYRGFQEYPERLVSGLTEAQLRQSPHPALNPIAWTLWHTARCEDVAVNRLLSDRAQVLEEGPWPTLRLTPAPGIGTGMPKPAARQLCAEIDLGELQAYRAAVRDRTESVIGALPCAELALELARERLVQVFVEEGVGGAAAEGLVEAYCGRTRGWLLGHLALTHHFYHCGQAFGVRAMWGAPNPW